MTSFFFIIIIKEILIYSYTYKKEKFSDVKYYQKKFVYKILHRIKRKHLHIERNRQ